MFQKFNLKYMHDFLIVLQGKIFLHYKQKERFVTVWILFDKLKKKCCENQPHLTKPNLLVFLYEAFNRFTIIKYL